MAVDYRDRLRSFSAARDPMPIRFLYTCSLFHLRCDGRFYVSYKPRSTTTAAILQPLGASGRERKRRGFDKV